ncbi:MAG: AraC family ligand binding domain-containing protein, partial [Oscillospiraceae bacterium]|nr:AraC family ligand binding domain-containing protein [Oscillospiraceae bacterium]
MFFCDYPIIRNEKELPVYLLNMGQHYCQDHIIRAEGYPCPQILYCTKGSGTLLLDGKKIHIPPCTAIFMPAFYPHEYYTESDVWDIHWIVPSGYAANDILKHFGLEKPKVYELKEVKMLEHIFRKMHEAIRADNVFGNYRASGYLYDFLIEFYRLISAEGTSGAPNTALMKAVDYINFNYASP